MDVNEVFKNAETAEIVSESEAQAMGIKKEDAASIMAEYEVKCANDPTLMQRSYSLSGSVEVLKTLGTNKEDEDKTKSSLIHDKEASEAKKQEIIKTLIPEFVATGLTEEQAKAKIEENMELAKKSKEKTDDAKALKAKYSYRVVKKTTGICGYIMKNIGTAPIEYPTQECVKGEDGVWVATPKKAVAQPGEEFQITRKHAIILGTYPEFSFQFANARIIARSKDDVDKYVQSSYINFNAKGKTVHDADVKIVIDKVNKAGDITVDKKFTTVFGYLENKVVKEPKAPKTPKSPEEKAKKAQLLQAAIATKLSDEINKMA